MFGVGVIGFGGFFVVYSYIVFFVIEVVGLFEWVVLIVFVLMGLGMMVGNFVGGYFVDIDLCCMLLFGFVMMVVVFVLFVFLLFWIVSLVVMVFVVGFVFFVLSLMI